MTKSHRIQKQWIHQYSPPLIDKNQMILKLNLKDEEK